MLRPATTRWLELLCPRSESVRAVAELAATGAIEIQVRPGAAQDYPLRHLAQGLADLLEGLDAFVNLIPYNPIPGREWRPSPPERIAAFLGTLEARGVEAAVRRPRGRDIAAACGQLRLERAGPDGTAVDRGELEEPLSEGG